MTVNDEERKAARKPVKAKGIVRGRPMDMWRHLKNECVSVPKVAKGEARNALSTAKGGSANVSNAVAAAVPHCDDARVSEIPAFSGKRRRATALLNGDIRV